MLWSEIQTAIVSHRRPTASTVRHPLCPAAREPLADNRVRARSLTILPLGAENAPTALRLACSEQMENCVDVSFLIP
jgi:hypothetical protein